MPMQTLKPETVAALRRNLLAWYAESRRDLPWRRTKDPYAIWVSEIMLQQTRVAAVVDRFQLFLARFPNVEELAAATEQDILALWSGLGYYRRARMLHSAARMLVARGLNSLPASAAELRALPGIGAYTAAAIASIAQGEAVAVVDGNVERVLCRLMRWSMDADAATMRRKIERVAAQLVHPQQPGDFNQAMMELGATVCLPRGPRCTECPLHTHCLTRGEHKTRPRAAMQTREIAHALAVRVGPAGQGREVLLEQRSSSQTVMPGLWELPALRNISIPESELRMTVRHSIMQVNYTVRIRNVSEGDAKAITAPAGRRRWVPVHIAAQMPLTGLARKVLSRANLLPAPRLDSTSLLVLEDRAP
ncbi:MAG TPA: A/G-specific adenine glycosylase [Terracidiphilus sp.]